MSTYEIREYRPGDEQAILATFNHVFRGPGSTLPPRSLAEWRWQFLENPGGWRMVLAVTDGVVAAQQAGIGYRASVEGRECSFSQTLDSMVHPLHRSGLKNPGLFVQVGTTYIETYGGPRDLAFIGWPNPQARRIGKAFLGYRAVHTQSGLGRELAPSTRGTAVVAPAGVERLREFDGSVSALWERCAVDWGASVRRDAAFLNWRFRDHPLARYDLFAVRDPAKGLAGYAVARRADWPTPGGYVIADWLVRPDATDAAELLLVALEAEARRQSCPAMVALFPEWSSWFDAFQRAGFRVWVGDLTLGLQIHVPQYSLAWMRDHCWYQLAESDFV